MVCCPTHSNNILMPVTYIGCNIRYYCDLCEKGYRIKVGYGFQPNLLNHRFKREKRNYELY